MPHSLLLSFLLLLPPTPLPATPNNLLTDIVLPSRLFCAGPLTRLQAARALRRRLARQNAQVLAEEDLWGVDGARNPNLRPYDNEFGTLLGKHRYFDHLLQERKAQGKKTHLLDLFGSGVVADLENLDSATGVRLMDVPIGTPDPAGKRGVVEGDLFKQETWKRLKANLRARGIPDRLDIITVRPVGAFADLEHRLAGSYAEIDPRAGAHPEEAAAFQSAYVGVIRKAYDLLSSDSGLLLVQMPIYADRPSWVAQLREAGFAVEADGRALKITRTADSPTKFPALK